MNMRNIAFELIIILLVLTSLWSVASFAAEVKKAERDFDVGKALLDSYDLIEKKQYKKADALLDQILAKDPGNPLALSNKASIMVVEKKFDKAEAYLEQALPRARGYMVHVNRVCTVGNICLAFKPATTGTTNQELEPLIKMNIELVKGYMLADPGMTDEPMGPGPSRTPPK
ncbi:MAG: tetratricopeptide repeat protein [Deltaproteobacteria bacterium]|nr:MAG: tetratricopeptide repeat protein [Deltaproteobacteria bacterium]